jgi:flagellar FliL protein
MAADEKQNKNELELDSSGNKKKIIIIAAVVITLAIAVSVFLFMGDDSEVSSDELQSTLDQTEMADGDGAEASDSEGSAYYVPMPRPFRFNVPGANRDRFVEIRVQLLTRGSDNEESAKKHIPLIESTLLAVFSQSNADNLVTSAGKLSLKQKSLAEVQKIMTDIERRKVVEQVLFTGFVMQ